MTSAMSVESKRVKDTGHHSGSISYKAFCRAAEMLSSGDFWSLRKPSPNSLLAGVPGHIYLSGREMFLPAPPPSTPEKQSAGKHNGDNDVASHDDDVLLTTLADLEPIDEGVITSEEKLDTESNRSTSLRGCEEEETGSTLVRIRHEILYQTAYEVPLMILKASNPDGSPVDLERANEMLKFWQRKELTLPVPEAKCYLIQQDHPVEGTPILAMKVKWIFPCIYLCRGEENTLTPTDPRAFILFLQDMCPRMCVCVCVCVCVFVCVFVCVYAVVIYINTSRSRIWIY